MGWRVDDALRELERAVPRDPTLAPVLVNTYLRIGIVNDFVIDNAAELKPEWVTDDVVGRAIIRNIGFEPVFQSMCPLLTMRYDHGGNLCVLAYEDILVGKQQRKMLCLYPFRACDSNHTLAEALITNYQLRAVARSYYLRRPEKRRIFNQLELREFVREVKSCLDRSMD
jgi:hypothetical protein